MIAILRVNLGMGDHKLVAFFEVMQFLNPFGIQRSKARQGSWVIAADGYRIGHESILASSSVIARPVLAIHL